MTDTALSYRQRRKFMRILLAAPLLFVAACDTNGTQNNQAAADENQVEETGDDFGNWVENVGDDIANAADDATNAVENAAEDVTGDGDSQ
jgi:hypothetical protein